MFSNKEESLHSMIRQLNPRIHVENNINIIESSKKHLNKILTV
jgi:hypothetical protein